MARPGRSPGHLRSGPLALAVPVIDGAVDSTQHHLVMGIARPYADLVAVGVHGDSRFARAREHHHPGRPIATVGRLVGACRTCREACDLAPLELLLTIDRSHDD